VANPQVENGYVRISNALFDAILSYPGITGVDVKVVFYIIRSTYGWNRKKTQLSNGEIARECRVARPPVIRSLRKLADHKIIFIQHTQGELKPNIIGINKDYEKWKNNIQGRRQEDQSGHLL